jgi:hypothetical protein
MNTNTVFNYLKTLPERNDFWEDRLGGYNKHVFLMNADETNLDLWLKNECKLWTIKQKRLLNNL